MRKIGLILFVFFNIRIISAQITNDCQPYQKHVNKDVKCDYCKLISNQKTFVAYIKSDTVGIFGHNLYIKNLLTDSIRKINLIPDYSESGIELLSWSSNGNIIWGVIQHIEIEFFFKYNIQCDSLRLYKFSKNLGSKMEFSLNPDLSLLLYSDFPTFYNTEDLNNFKKSNKKVTLYIYNFENALEKLIATNISKEFKPYWICPDYFQFQSSDSDKIIKRKN